MVCVTQSAQALIEVKQSKFFAHIVPINLMEQTIEALRTEHPKARHIIVASRALNVHHQIEEQATDDAEPKGTAGKPVLNVMRGSELINTAVIVVRYFGGTKLGTGGLVRAYGDAAKAVISAARLVSFEIKRTVTVRTDYAKNAKVEHFLGQHHIEITHKDYDVQAVVFQLRVTVDQERELMTLVEHQLAHLPEDVIQ